MNTDLPHDAKQPVDNIAYWPLAFAIGIPAVIIVCTASLTGPALFYALVVIPALLLSQAIAAIWAMVAGFTAARVGAWRRSVTCFLLPLVVLANVPGPFAALHFYNGIGNVIHFEVMRNHYQSIVRSLPGTGSPKLVIFNWGGMLWASNGVVYDESDEIARGTGRQSASWVARAANTELACGGYSITSMGGHFYLADFPC